MAAATTPTSTYKSFLMQGTTTTVENVSTTTWSKLVDIKNYPDMGGSPELLDTTTLSDGMQTHIFGIQQNDTKEFTCNYVKSDYTTIKALEGTELDLALWFGGSVSDGVATPTGDDGKMTFKGYVSVYVNGGDVNAVREMTVSVAVSSPITFA